MPGIHKIQFVWMRFFVHRTNIWMKSYMNFFCCTLYVMKIYNSTIKLWNFTNYQILPWKDTWCYRAMLTFSLNVIHLHDTFFLAIQTWKSPLMKSLKIMSSMGTVILFRGNYNSHFNCLITIPVCSCMTNKYVKNCIVTISACWMKQS